jgi:hypothetical protein
MLALATEFTKKRGQIDDDPCEQGEQAECSSGIGKGS